MRYLFFFISLFAVANLKAQYVYTIKADSVKITNCDSAELILENHTQNIPGFLFNTGNGRTIFKHGIQKLTNSSFLIGADTLNLPNAWVQHGNQFGDTGVIGTNDNFPVDLYSNGSRRARLSVSGNLLVGTTSELPNYKTQIAGNSWWSTGNGAAIVNSTMSTSSDIVQLGGYLNLGDGQNALVSVSNNSGASYSNVLVERLGYVGIGSTAPTGWLVGHPNIRIGTNGVISYSAPQIIYGNTPGPTNASGLVTLVSNINEWNEGTSYPSGQNFYYFGTTLQGPISGYKRAPLYISGDYLAFNSGFNEAEAGRFSEGHNFLIGDTADDGVHKIQVTGGMLVTGATRLTGLTQDSTQTRILVSDNSGNLYYRSAASLALDNPIRSSLAVNGTIKSKKIIISPDEWADYVFDSTYRLPNLATVESYIHREHHLPGIPSAADVQKDSLDIGAGQEALLKKIEELTLYTIEQKKEIDVMKARMEKLENLLLDKSKEK